MSLSAFSPHREKVSLPRLEGRIKRKKKFPAALAALKFSFVLVLSYLFNLESYCFVRINNIALGRKASAGAALAPHAGAGTYFHERVKVGKGLSRGEYRFSPLESPLNDQRLCLWNPSELPLCILFPHRNKPVSCSLCVRCCFAACE